MKKKALELYKNGHTYIQISEILDISLFHVGNLLTDAPKGRLCRNCKSEFEPKKGRLYCSDECKRAYRNRATKVDKQAKRRKAQTLDEALRETNMQGLSYAEMQIAETLSMIGGRL